MILLYENFSVYFVIHIRKVSNYLLSLLKNRYYCVKNLITIIIINIPIMKLEIQQFLLVDKPDIIKLQREKINE